MALVAVFAGCHASGGPASSSPPQRIPLALHHPKFVNALLGVPYRFTLHVACGRAGDVLFDGSYWEYVYGALRPKSIHGKRVHGTIRLFRWGLAVFRDARGGQVTFGRRTYPVARGCTLGGGRASLRHGGGAA